MHGVHPDTAANAPSSYVYLTKIHSLTLMDDAGPPLPAEGTITLEQYWHWRETGESPWMPEYKESA